MNFRYSEDEERFRQEVLDFIKNNLTPEASAETFGGSIRGPKARDFVKKMAEAGLLGLSWPKEYGGKEMPSIYDFILNEELAYAKAPQAGHGVGIVGRTLMVHGSEWQKKEFLPKILNEEVEFALGYSEPEAGSDLAALQLRAIEDGDDYVFNGQKLFCSAADTSEYVWCLARTDPTLPKHKGVSIFIVDLRSPGITIRILTTICGDRTTEVFFDNVRVPKKYLVGQLNKGFVYAMEALAYERQVMFPANFAQGLFDMFLDWVKNTTIDGKPLAKDPLIRHKVARLAVEMEAFQMLGLRVAMENAKGLPGDIEAAMHKLYGSHLEQRLANAAVDIMGLYGQLVKGSKHAPLDGKFDNFWRFSILRTVGGGSSEIQKNIIATRHLGLPRI
jgi:hypothetical protein